jgi:hypothetical protein
MIRRLSSFVRCGTVARWLEELERKVRGGKGVTRSAQGDVFLGSGYDYAFCGQVRPAPGGVQVLPFFWQPQGDVFASISAATAGSNSLLDSPIIPPASADYVVAVMITGTLENVVANAETSTLTFDRVVAGVDVVALSSLPASQIAQITAVTGVIVTDDLPIPVFEITDLQPDVTYYIPIATVRQGRISHVLLPGGEWVHGRGTLLADLPVRVIITQNTPS